MTRLILENVALYSAQVLAVAAMGGLLDVWLRGKDPRARLLHWQTVLAICLLLPLLQSWQRPAAGAVEVVLGPARLASPLPAASQPVAWEPWVLGLLAGGALLWLLRLGMGVWRVASYRRNSEPLEGAPRGVEVRVCAGLPGPATYGWRRPLILLPPSFHALSGTQRRAVLAHELAHVRRKDWLAAMGEEIVRAVLWFHPAVWYAIGRIHVAREQVVDLEVVRGLGERDAYLDTLLSVAGVKAQIEVVPGPPFLRQRHLAERVAVILKEATQMSVTQLMLSAAWSAAAIGTTGLAAGALLPLRAPAQETPARTSSQTSGGRLLHKVEPSYPPDAKMKGVEGTVALSIAINEQGRVFDAKVLAGPSELHNAALQAVLQWEFVPNQPGRATVETEFRLNNKDNEFVTVLRGIDYSGLAETERRRMEARIAVKPGENVTRRMVNAIAEAAHEVQPGTYVALDPVDGILRFGVGKGALRIGGNKQSAKLTKKVAPLYPAQAKQSRVQGQVRLEVLIDRAGKVAHVRSLSGDPLLVDAAIEGVRQWEYEPTHLNGNPVDVITVVDVNFTLAP